MIIPYKIDYGKESEEYLNSLIDFYNYNVIEEMSFEQMFALNLITEYFESVSDYQKAYKCLKEIINIVKK